VPRQLGVALLALVVVAGCSPQRAPAAGPPASATSTAAASPGTAAPTSVPAPTTLTGRTEKWVDLQVGDCVAELPAVDLGAVTVDIVDCAAAHQAEVYLLAPIAVNAAVTDVANQACSAGLAPYTGESSAFAVTYLIDSRQDRTSANPLPSTVICLLQAVDARPLTGSARQ
jgi:hypothetical protein